jgi:hypothetical protein
MPMANHAALKFESQSIAAGFIDPSGQAVKKNIEIRTHPITGRTCRITFRDTTLSYLCNPCLSVSLKN